MDIVHIKKKVMKFKIGLPMGDCLYRCLDKARILRRSQLNEEQDLSEPERLHPLYLALSQSVSGSFRWARQGPFLDLVEGSRCWLGRCEERAVPLLIVVGVWV